MQLEWACSYSWLECVDWLLGEVLLHSVPLLTRKLATMGLKPAMLENGIFATPVSGMCLLHMSHNCMLVHAFTCFYILLLAGVACLGGVLLETMGVTRDPRP